MEKKTDSLWNYDRDEPNKPPTVNYDGGLITYSASFKYKVVLQEKY